MPGSPVLLRGAAAGLIALSALTACERPNQQATAAPQQTQVAATSTAAATPTTAATPTSQPSPTAQASAATRVYRDNIHSVVNVNSLAVQQLPTGGTQQQPRGLGSGFVYDDQGHIVTNNHVIENADQLTVTLPVEGKRITVPATLVGRDPLNDLAVIKVDPAADTEQGTVGSLLKPVALGSMSDVVVGESVVAMGAPLGLTHSVTTGIVSAIRSPGAQETRELELVAGLIQTDTPINPGNSGGPLFDADGKVIGVNTAGLSPSGGSIGLNFAIPVDVVKRVTPQLIEKGCVRHPLIGISAIPLAQLGQATKRQLGVPLDRDGLLVQEVSAGAAEAGIQAGQQTVNLGPVSIRTGGDIVVAIDGEQISSGNELRAYVEQNKQPGDTVTLTILRNGQRQDVTVTLTERPAETCREQAG